MAVARRSGRAAAQDAALEGHPLVDRVVAVDDAAPGRLELARLDLRQEPDLAEVDAEERHVDLDDGTRGAQERAVAAEDDQHIGRRELADERRRGRPLGLPLVDAADLAPAGGPGAQLDRGVVGRVVGEADALDASSRPVASAIRSSISAQPGPARGGQELAVALRPEDRRGDDRARAEPELGAHRDDPLEDLAVDRRVADDAVVGPAPPGLELRLHERRRSWPRGVAERGRDRAEDQAREMNETSIMARSIGSGRVAAVRVRALVRSMETTRGSRRSGSASWPRPTSTA